jgi:glutathione S-transferase
MEFRLRTSSTPYTPACGSTFKGPKGKIPYVELSTSSSTEQLADSSLILKSLSENGLVKDLNARLSSKEKSLDLAVRAMMEDKLTFYQTYERWILNYYAMRDYALSAIPYPIRIGVGMLAYRGNVRKLYDQGTGRFSAAEILEFKREVWNAIDLLLEDSQRKVFDQKKGKDAERIWWVLGGEEPTEADATIYGFVVSVLVSTAGPESQRLLKDEFPGVVEWAERVHRRWFPDYEMWV